MEIESVFLFLALAAFVAGLVDAVVGGGGLVQIPALFSAFPNSAPAVLFGTNKIASVFGTTSAAIQYARRISVPWRLALWGAAAAFIGSWFGAKAVVYLPPDILRPLILVLLIAVAIYTVRRKELGLHAAYGAGEGRRAFVLMLLIGAGVGFYDGFFGPGTGSFLIILFVRFLHLDFLRASAIAKVVNVATNVAAIIYFSTNVSLLWQLGLLMASCNLVGALVGSRLALKHGTVFVRRMFLFVVSALILRMAWDLFGAGS